MRVRTVLAALLLPLPLAVGSSCDRPGDLCDTQCDCEHCSDLDREQLCNRVHWTREVADTYGCIGDWNALADCVEDNGVCDEKAASFTTRESGACTLDSDTGFFCASSFDCTNNFGPQFFCSAGTCRFRTCADNSGFPCDSDDDCPEGVDKCQMEKDALETCEQNASANNPFLFPSSGSGVPVDG